MGSNGLGRHAGGMRGSGGGGGGGRGSGPHRKITRGSDLDLLPPLTKFPGSAHGGQFISLEIA